MDRRIFVKSGILTGVTGLAALGSASCTTVKFLESSAPKEPPPDMDEVLSRMDAGLRKISDWNLVDDFTETSDSGPERDNANRVARNAVKSLYVTAMFCDMPVSAQVQPGAQKRIMAALPEMEEAARELEGHLDTHCHLSDEELREFLRRDDDPGMRFLESFNNLAKDHGITAQRRLQIRAMTTNILWRLKNQPPGLLLSECNEKMKRAYASAGPDVAAQHLVAANVTEEAFWQWQEEQGREPDEGVEDYSNWNEFETSDKESQKSEKKKSGVKKGAKMMGIGLLMFGAGAGLAVAGAAPGVVLGTIGAIFFLIGLIRLLVAAISGSEPDSDGEEEK